MYEQGETVLHSIEKDFEKHIIHKPNLLLYSATNRKAVFTIQELDSVCASGGGGAFLPYAGSKAIDSIKAVQKNHEEFTILN